MSCLDSASQHAFNIDMSFLNLCHKGLVYSCILITDKWVYVKNWYNWLATQGYINTGLSWYWNLAPPIAPRDAFWSTLSPLSLRSCKPLTSTASEGAGGTEVNRKLRSHHIASETSSDVLVKSCCNFFTETRRYAAAMSPDLTFVSGGFVRPHCAAIDISSEFWSKATNKTFHPTRGRGQFAIGRPSCANWVTQRCPRFMSAGIFQEWKDLSKIASWLKILFWILSWIVE